MPARTRALAAVTLLAAAFVLGGCRVDARVVVTLQHDGSGLIDARAVLDADAVAALEAGGGTLEERVVLDGLAEAGWEVRPWRREDGRAILRVSHRFADAADLDARLADLFGPDGLLRHARIDRERGFIRSVDGLEVEADLRELDSGVLTDTELGERLRAAGVDPAAVDARLDAALAESFELAVVLRVPGETARTVRLGPGDHRRVELTHARDDYDRAITVAAAGLAVLLGLVLLAAMRMSARRERRRRLAPPPPAPPTW